MESQMRRQEQQVGIERVVLVSRRREEVGSKGEGQLTSWQMCSAHSLVKNYLCTYSTPFEGHPEGKIDTAVETHHKAGTGDTNYEEVRGYFAHFKQLEVHKGEFSMSVKSLPGMTFGLAHLDVDLYAATLDGLSYFGPKMAPGGIMVIDDYGVRSCPGKNKAVAEYLHGREQNSGIWHMGNSEQLILIKR